MNTKIATTKIRKLTYQIGSNPPLLDKTKAKKNNYTIKQETCKCLVPQYFPNSELTVIFLMSAIKGTV
jgi:hypothetical protein